MLEVKLNQNGNYYNLNNLQSDLSRAFNIAFQCLQWFSSSDTIPFSPRFVFACIDEKTHWRRHNSGVSVLGWKRVSNWIQHVVVDKKWTQSTNWLELFQHTEIKLLRSWYWMRCFFELHFGLVSMKFGCERIFEVFYNSI